MQNISPTMEERLSAIGGAAIVAVVIFGIASVLHLAISRKCEQKRIQGRSIRWWVTGLFMAGAVAGSLIADNRRYYISEIVAGLGGVGLLAGLLIGHIHGGINLLRRSDTPSTPESDASMIPSESIPRTHYDDGNPYAPPIRCLNERN